MKNNKIFLNLFFLLTVFGLGFLAFSQEAQAATYYVAMASDGGSDSNNGLESTPWATFNYAISQVSAGSTIIAKAGTYNQTITVTKPSITIQGELDYSGNRLSIIDPYMNASGEWTDTGNGVWSKNFAYPVYAMNVEVDGVKYNVPRYCQPDDYNTILGGANSDYFCNGLGPNGDGIAESWDYWLRVPNSNNYQDYESQDWINVWDIFETNFSCKNVSPYTCYVRFRDQTTNMNSKTLYAAQNSQASIIVSASNVVIKDLDIKAIAKGISIGGLWGSEQTADSVTVQNCEITLGKVKVWVTSGGTNAHIESNVIHEFDYAHSYIATPEYIRGPGKINGTYAELIQILQRRFEKYKLSPDGNSYVNTAVLTYADNTIIENNNIYDLHSGMDSSNPGTNIIRNHIHDLTSVGAVFGENNGTIYISNNTWENTGTSAIRFMSWGGTTPGNQKGSNYTTAYIYNNKIYFPSADVGIGEGMKFHFNGCTVDCGTKTPGIAWIYHNSFSGGNKIAGMSSYEAPNTGLQGVHFINNVLSGGFTLFEKVPGECVYNWVSGMYYLGNCSGAGNSYSSTMMPGWDSATPHDFDITGTSAVDAGIDIVVNYPDLPGFSPNYYSGNPDMGAVQTGNPADVNGDGNVNIKDIQACIKVITGTDTRYQNQCKVLAAPTDRTNIKDIQVIIQKILNP